MILSSRSDTRLPNSSILQQVVCIDKYDNFIKGVDTADEYVFLLLFHGTQNVEMIGENRLLDDQLCFVQFIRRFFQTKFKHYTQIRIYTS